MHRLTKSNLVEYWYYGRDTLTRPDLNNKKQRTQNENRVFIKYLFFFVHLFGSNARIGLSTILINIHNGTLHKIHDIKEYFPPDRIMRFLVRGVQQIASE